MCLPSVLFSDIFNGFDETACITLAMWYTSETCCLVESFCLYKTRELINAKIRINMSDFSQVREESVGAKLEFESN